MIERACNGRFLIKNHFNRALVNTFQNELISNHLWNFSITMASEVVVYLTEIAVKVSSCSTCQYINVFVASITRLGDRANSLARTIESITQIAHSCDRCWVVCIIKNDFKRMLIKHVYPARRLKERRIESPQSMSDIF